MNLDGKDKITPTPFDAHEQVVRKPHTHVMPVSKQVPDETTGYQERIYEHEEFPKVVGETEKGDPIIADSELHEEVAADETSDAPKAHKPSRHR